MSIYHTIRKDGNGKTVEVSLTPARAIRKHCIECMGFVYSEIEGCTSPLCPLFPWKDGVTPIGYEIVGSRDSETLNSVKNPKPWHFKKKGDK